MIITTMDTNGDKATRRLTTAAITIGFLLAGFFLGGWLADIYLLPGLSKQVISAQPVKQLPKVKMETGPQIAEPFNLLLIGIDKGLENTWSGRTDTIVLVRFLPKEKKVKALSIPRDTLGNIPGRGLDKLNHAFAYGGTQLSIKTVENFTGQKIDFYLQIDMGKFIKLVDEIGGVDFFVDRNISRKDMGIYLQTGQQHLDGRKALALVRFRYEPMGDIGRVKRQMRFVKAVINQSISKSKALDKPLIINKLRDNFQTDMSILQILALWNTFKDCTGDNVISAVVPGTFYSHNKVSYWKPDEKMLAKIKRDFF